MWLNRSVSHCGGFLGELETFVGLLRLQECRFNTGRNNLYASFRNTQVYSVHVRLYMVLGNNPTAGADILFFNKAIRPIVDFGFTSIPRCNTKRNRNN